MTLPLDALKEFPARLAEHLKSAPPAALDFAPENWEGCPSETYTLRQHACHLRDIEIDGYHVRFSRTLREDAPMLRSIDRDEFVVARNYDATPIDEALTAFSRARHETLLVLGRLSSTDMTRPATLEGHGRTNLQGLVHLLCSHDHQHFAGLHWLLAKFDRAN